MKQADYQAGAMLEVVNDLVTMWHCHNDKSFCIYPEKHKHRQKKVNDDVIVRWVATRLRIFHSTIGLIKAFRTPGCHCCLAENLQRQNYRGNMKHGNSIQ